MTKLRSAVAAPFVDRHDGVVFCPSPANHAHNGGISRVHIGGTGLVKGLLPGAGGANPRSWILGPFFVASGYVGSRQKHVAWMRYMPLQIPLWRHREVVQCNAGNRGLWSVMVAVVPMRTSTQYSRPN